MEKFPSRILPLGHQAQNPFLEIFPAELGHGLFLQLGGTWFVCAKL